MLKHFTFTLLIGLNLQCSSSVKTDRISRKEVLKAKISSIEIYDKTSKTKAIRKCIYYNPVTLKLVLKELKKADEIEEDVNVRMSQGFYELFIYDEFNREFVMQIIYTEFDGVVLNFDGGKFKNNNLEKIIDKLMWDENGCNSGKIKPNW